MNNFHLIMEYLKYEKTYEGFKKSLTDHYLINNGDFNKLSNWMFNYACCLKTDKEHLNPIYYISTVKSQIKFARSMQRYFDSDLCITISEIQVKKMAVIYLYIWNCICHTYTAFIEIYDSVKKSAEKPLYDDQITEAVQEIYKQLEMCNNLQKQFINLFQVLIEIGSFYHAEIQSNDKFKVGEYDSQKLKEIVYDLCMLIAKKYDEEYIFNELENLKKMGPGGESTSNEYDDENECPVCFNDFENKTTLKCTHSFCKICITSWMSGSGTDNKLCPMCKQKIVIVNNAPKPKVPVLKAPIPNSFSNYYNQKQNFYEAEPIQYKTTNFYETAAMQYKTTNMTAKIHEKKSEPESDLDKASKQLINSLYQFMPKQTSTSVHVSMPKPAYLSHWDKTQPQSISQPIYIESKHNVPTYVVPSYHPPSKQYYTTLPAQVYQKPKSEPTYIPNYSKKTEQKGNKNIDEPMKFIVLPHTKTSDNKHKPSIVIYCPEEDKSKPDSKPIQTVDYTKLLSIPKPKVPILQPTTSEIPDKDEVKSKKDKKSKKKDKKSKNKDKECIIM
jgi:hypothetical protein